MAIMSWLAVVPAAAGLAVPDHSPKAAVPVGPKTGRWPARIRRAAAGLVLCVVLVLAPVLPAAAVERITAFASDVVLATDGSVSVTETIDIVAEGNEIRRGIYRDIPTVMINPDGSRLRSTLTVSSVRRGGRDEPFALERLGPNATRIRIGDADVLLPRGPQRYEIRYSMTRMARRFADHDELYWNATGNYWNFPIETAVASVTLPPGAVIGDLAAYTGPAGSTESAVTITRAADDRAVYRVTRRLAAGEGLTVVAGFNTGVLLPPSSSQLGLDWLSDHRDLVLPVLAVLIVLAYNLFAWGAVGRDPARGTIIPLFHPPKDFSPALVHYVHRFGWQNSGWTAFTAAIFDLGARGLLRIDNVGKTLSITALKQQAPKDLPPGEALLFAFLRSRGKVTVDKANGKALDEKRSEFVRRLETENRQVYFRHNTGYVVLGVVLAIACMAAMLAAGVLSPEFGALAIAVGVGIGLFATLLRAFWTGGGVARIILVAWVVLAGGNLLGGLSSLLTDFALDTPLIAAVSIVVIHVAFAILMRAPTVQGRKVMDEIDGLKMYLETAEKERLNLQGEPPLTVERFERLLPYAIALGVEKPWAEHFEAELARNAVPDAPPNYAPSWYRGGDFSGGSSGFSRSVASMATGMSAAMLAAQPVSSSSSGFSGGGGGSSGGGGGGGGGGGW